MTKFLLLLLFAAVSVGVLRAQTAGERPGAGRFEGEVALGATFGHASLEVFATNAVGFCLAGECRYNFRRLPFDAGLRLQGACFSRDPGTCSGTLFPSLGLMAVTDYNLRVSRKLDLFAGVGVGGAWMLYTTEKTDADFEPGGEIHFCVMPRVGCECWNRLRVTLGYFCTERANSHLSLTLGIAIGGGRRQR